MFVLGRIGTAATTIANLRGVKRTGISLQSRTNSLTKRWATTHETGALLEEPEVVHFGLIKVVMTVVPGLYIGASISRTCAAFLEENDIFVPDDDDDDD